MFGLFLNKYIMKKFLIGITLCLSVITLKAQQGFLNLNDFNPLNNPQGWPFNESIYWLRGTTPPGGTRIMVYRGTLQARFLQDTILFPKLSIREDANPYKLIWIGQDSMLRAITPPYLKITDTTGKWLGAGTTIPSAQVNSDWSSVSGVSQILNKPALKRVETYLGSTDGSGNYTVTYSPAFSTTPDVQPQLQAGTASQIVRITASSTTGFTVNVTNRSSVTLLGFDLLLASTTVVSGSSVGVLVTER
jgi:hypothetical protein